MGEIYKRCEECGCNLIVKIFPNNIAYIGCCDSACVSEDIRVGSDLYEYFNKHLEPKKTDSSVERLNSQRIDLMNANIRLEKELKDRKRQNKVLNNEIDQINNRYQKLNDKFDELERRHKTLNKGYDFINTGYNKLYIEHRKLTAEVEVLKAENKKLRDCNPIIERITIGEYLDDKKIISELERQHKTLKEGYEILKTDYNKLDAEYRGLEDKNADLKYKNKNLTERNNILLSDIMKLGSDLGEKNKKHDELVLKLGKIKEAIKE
jgi:chromosome segregation ATPase